MAEHGFVLDPALVSDCATRLAIARALDHGMADAQDATDRELIHRHAGLYNEVVLKVWPAIAESPAVPEDGDMKDAKWMLLRDELLTDATLESLLRPRVVSDLDAGATNLLMKRCVRSLQQVLREKSSAPRSHPSERLFALAILSRMNGSPDPDAIAHAVLGAALTPQERSASERLMRRFARHEAAEWTDLQDLWDY